jgi:vitamin B12 transporter
MAIFHRVIDAMRSARVSTFFRRSRNGVGWRSASRSLAVAIMASGALFAEDGKASPTNRYLDPVIVTATRSESSLSRTGIAVSVIGSREISNLGFMKPVEYLRLSPGVSIAQNSPLGGGQSSVYVRGAGFGQTLFMVDGVPIHDPSSAGGTPSFEMLNFAFLDRIEVLRGSQSSLYGSDALGGVINLITRGKSDRVFAPVLTLEYGSYQSLNILLALKGSVAKFSYDLSGGWESTAGASKAQEPDNSVVFKANPYTNLLLSGKLSFRPTDDSLLQVSGRWNGSMTSLDNGTFSDSTNFNSAGSNSSLTFAWEQRPVAPWRYRIHHDWSRFQSTNLDTAAFSFQNSLLDGQQHAGSFQNDLDFGKHKITAGLDWRFETINYSDSFAPVTGSNQTLFGGFAQYLLDLDAFTASASGRLEGSGSSGLVGTFHMAAAWQSPMGLRLSVSGGNAWKAPTLYQLYVPMFGNPALKPETSLSFDASVGYVLTNAFRIGVTYFHQVFSNQIDFGFAYNNTAASRMQGVELDARLCLDPRWAAGLAYTFLDARNLTTGAFLWQRPANTVSIYGDVRLVGRISLGVNLGYTGARLGVAFDPFTYASTTVSTPEYWKLDARVSVDLVKQVTLFFRGENLLDQKVSTIYGYKNPGILVFGGVKVAL